MWESLGKEPPSSYNTVRPRYDSSSSSATHLEPPPKYSEQDHFFYSDPRASSQHSLVPSVPDPDNESRRTLLVIYIHGFNGNSQSFRSFPAHIHGFLKHALSETHVVHTKLYPRYKTYKAVEVARDKFSEWLEPHEGPNVDVVLVGHSMGGIVASDVILMPNRNPNVHHPYKHRIVGQVALDCPYLGLHPGIVVSGIASLFQSAPKLQDDPTYVQPLGSESTLSFATATATDAGSIASSSPSLPRPHEPDPFFNAPFFNDKTYEERPFLQSISAFVMKHRAEGVANSVYKRLMDQLEYGSCLADYPALHARYKKIRALEDVDEIQAVGVGQAPGKSVQVRFVNYYTLSSGVIKQKAKSPDNGNESPEEESALDMDPLGRQAEAGSSLPTGTSTSVQPDNASLGGRRCSISVVVEDHDDAVDERATNHVKDSESTKTSQDEMVLHAISDDKSSDVDFNRLSMQDLDPVPMSDSEEANTPVPTTEPPVSQAPEDGVASSSGSVLNKTQTEELNLPPLPAEPASPELPDLDQYTEKASRKQAEKESKRLQKAYEQAVKDRQKAIREREKLIEKRRKEAQKTLDKQEKQAQKEQDNQAKKEKERLEKEQQRMEKEKQRMEKEAAKLAGKKPDAATSNGADEAQQIVEEARELNEKPKKRKKFCTLPGKINGQPDETWVDIYMDGMTEVTAHCGLFFAGPHYDKLVGDVGSRIVGWVQDDLTKRAVLDMPVD